MTNTKLSYVLRTNKKRKDNKSPIYLRISVNQQIREISTKKYLKEDHWDSNKQRVKNSAESANVLNAFMDQLYRKALEAETSLLQEGKDVNAINIKRKLVPKRKKENVCLMSFFEMHNKRLKELIGKDYSESTFKKYKTCLKHLKAFIKNEFSRKTFNLSELNIGFIRDFEHYLKTKDSPCNHNTTLKYISHLKKVINEALEREIIKNDPFKLYNEKYEDKDPVYLTDEELSKIENKKFEIDRLERIKDIFIFSCYTGFAYIDITRLDKGSVNKGREGDWWIYLNRKKTNEPSIVPLLETPKKIINKYSDDPETDDGRLLPYKSNQKTNAYLKEIAAVAGINKHLTFHVARHTFATTVTLENEVPMETVQKILGHKDARSTMHYARVTKRKLNTDMNRLQERLNSIQ